MTAAAMHRCICELDVVGARRLWAHARPNMPQPKTNADALMMLHHARTQMPTIAFKLRAYSHRWLLDNGFPSGLPDRLKPKAEREYPKVVGAVGIALGGTSAIAKAIIPLVMKGMTDVVMDCYANGDTEPALIKSRMMAAKSETTRKLLGKVASS